MLRRLLEKDPARRVPAKQALQLDWIKLGEIDLRARYNQEVLGKVQGSHRRR